MAASHEHYNHRDMSKNKRAGSIEVTIISATLFPRGGSESGSFDTYATVILGGQQFSTKVAKDHGVLPVWNEKHALDFDSNGIEADLIDIQIFAAYSEVPQLLAVARLPLSSVLEAREETSLLPLHQPSEGYECGQLKLTLKRVSLESKNQPAAYGAEEETDWAAAPPLTAQRSVPSFPAMSYEGYGAPPGDAAAHALSSLSLDKEKEQRYGPPAEGPPSAYPSSLDTSNPYASSQGPPYLASPISGVVTPPYGQPPSADSYSQKKSDGEYASANPYGAPSAPAYGAPSGHPEPGYPPSTGYPGSSPYPGPTYGLNLPENLDVSTGGKEKTKGSPYPSDYHGGAPPHSEGYPPAHSDYPPQYESGPGGHPGANPYGSLAPAPYPQPESYEGQIKQKVKKEKDPSAPKYDGAPSPQSGYPPSDYAPSAVPYDQSAAPLGYPPEQGGGGEYPGAKVKKDKHKGEAGLSSSGEGVYDGTGEKLEKGETGEKGFKKNQMLNMAAGMAGGTAYGGGHGGYGQHGYAQPGYPQPGYAPQAGYSQPGYGHQPMYQQPGYAPSHGYAAPNYPPAYPGHGYAPEAYPSHGGYAAQPYGGHGGHGGSHGGHMPAPYGAYGAPMHGGHGHYKQHKGGHKGYKHKKMKKMKKGHYLHFQQPYGYGGHHGKHKKHKY